jgi:hypothetical protein
VREQRKGLDKIVAVDSSPTSRRSHLTSRLQHFIAKSATERRETLTFLGRGALAKLPYFPFRFVLNLPTGENIPFWWSYVHAV